MTTVDTTQIRRSDDEDEEEGESKMSAGANLAGARIPGDLTPSEVRLAKRRHIVTVTSETPYGYYVTVFQLKGDDLSRLAQSKEFRRPRTARIYGARLVRAALAST